MSIFRRPHRRSSSSGDVFDVSSFSGQAGAEGASANVVTSGKSVSKLEESLPDPPPASKTARGVLSRLSLHTKPKNSSQKSPIPSPKTSTSSSRFKSSRSVQVSFEEASRKDTSHWFSLGWKNLTPNLNSNGKINHKASRAFQRIKQSVSPIPRSFFSSPSDEAKERENGNPSSSNRSQNSRAGGTASVMGVPFSEITRKYRIGEQLGTGTFGVVRRCTDRSSGANLAVKTVLKSGLLADSDCEDLRNEVQTLSAVGSHPHVVKLHSVLEDAKSVHLVMEMCSGGDLFHRIRLRRRFSEAAAARVCQNLASAVSHFWERGVVHRDLKPENILLASADCDWDVRVADFGKACFLAEGETRTDVVGTPFYLPPEVLAGRYGREADMWCLGVILFILLCGRPPFWAREKEDIFDLIEAGQYDTRSGVWETISAGAKDLVRRMLTMDPTQRIAPHRVKDHPWILYHCLHTDFLVTASVVTSSPDYPSASSPESPGQPAASPSPPPPAAAVAVAAVAAVAAAGLYSPLSPPSVQRPSSPTAPAQRQRPTRLQRMPSPAPSSSLSPSPAARKERRSSQSDVAAQRPPPVHSHSPSAPDSLARPRALFKKPSVLLPSSLSAASSPDDWRSPALASRRAPVPVPAKSPSSSWRRPASPSAKDKRSSPRPSRPAYSAPHSPSAPSSSSHGIGSSRQRQPRSRGSPGPAAGPSTAPAGEDLSVDELLVLLMSKLEQEKQGSGEAAEDAQASPRGSFLSDISQRLDRIGGARVKP